MTQNRRVTAPEIEGAAWVKSSYSGGSEGQCVEIADVTQTHDSVAVRDSKNPTGPALMVSPDTFTAFITNVIENEASR